MELTRTACGCEYYRDKRIGGEDLLTKDKCFVRAFKPSEMDYPPWATRRDFDDSVVIFFDDCVDGNCRFLRFKKDEALELAHNIIKAFGA